jgi:hypothetical protein
MGHQELSRRNPNQHVRIRIFNTSRQAGGALAVAVFGALLASRAGFVPGLRVSLLIAAAVVPAAAAVTTRLSWPAGRSR